MRGSSLVLALGLSVVGVAATAEGYAERVTVQPIKLYLKDDRGRAVITVTNNSSETLDIEVNCIFYNGTKKTGGGSATVARLPPHRSDTLDIPDRQTLPLDSVRCDVSRAEK